ncbi:hypothetical protein AVEN_28770-1 [Araneus ventricosus]|uniref:Uncharacterized protein n=1 Tax=Araneus ventricosus TaxID=182803 RepID=A0A4Y2QB94_ARAVE|nr:hypothetical protein AVEN_28770-1 [Araneus ventricosus]
MSAMLLTKNVCSTLRIETTSQTGFLVIVGVNYVTIKLTPDWFELSVFLSYLHHFNLRTQDNCSCGEKGDPIHYEKCRFTLSWHFQAPTVSLKLQCLKNILTNNLSRTRLRLLMRFICDENNLIVEDKN